MGFKPFDMEGWVGTEDDRKWQSGMIEEKAKKFPEDAGHFEAERANIGGPRIRPEHVMATAFKNPWPVNQAEANAIGRCVIADYDKKRPPTLKLSPPTMPGR